MSYLTPERITGPEQVPSTQLVVFYVDIGEGLRGRAFAAESSIYSIDATDRIPRVCAALNRFIDRTSEEDVVDHLTTIRGVYLNDLELQGI